MKRYRTRVMAVASALLLAAALNLPAASPLRVLPVGDSITFGSSVPGGYRFPLYNLLTNAGYIADFVGTQTGNATNGQTEVEHEGHGGWRIQQISDIMVSVFDAIGDPDVILLLIGTNDFGAGDDTANATNRLDALIEKMATNRPYCKIVVANLLERGEPFNTQIQTMFNPAVPNIVQNHRDRGQEVYFTDLRSALTVADMPDNLHPGALGYAKMATNWFGAITNLFGPEGSTNAPAVTRARGLYGFTNVNVSFSKPVGDDATNLTHYTLGGGLTLLGATLDASRRVVTLRTSPQAPLTSYPLTVSGVCDRTDAATVMAADAVTSFRSSALGVSGVFNNVPEASEYSLLYSLNIPTTPNYSAGIVYDIDLRAYVTNPVRVAYYLELQTAGNPPEFAWVSTDAMVDDVNRLGVPTVASGAFYQQAAPNMTVLSSMASVSSGSNFTGWLEFWGRNYNATNALSVPGATTTAYDWGDMYSGSGTYGSMQVHHPDSNQVIFAFNRWGGSGGNCDLGIGNRPGATDVDWTFAQNASNYTVRTLHVFVLPMDNTNAPTLVSAQGSGGGTNVVLQFSEPLDDDATNLAHYGVTGGLTLLGVTLDPVTKTRVILTTSPQAPNTTYSVSAGGLHDRTAAYVAQAAGETTAFRSAPERGVFGNVPEAAEFSLAYSLDIGNLGTYNPSAPYNIDLHNYVSNNFTRVAYYLELQTAGGALQYVWAEMDPFTNVVTAVGMPTVASKAIFQQPVTNLTVESCVAGLVTGTNMTGGNIEFWPGNYSASNAMGVANASDTVYDWGDIRTSGNHGSMQVHNHDASQCVFGINHWGGAGGIIELGIGNYPSGNPDWTFANNATSYVVKTLQVFVLPADNTNAPSVVSAQGLPGLTNVLLTFSEPLDDDATNLAHYAIDGGVNVLSAALDPLTKVRVTLTTTPQPAGAYRTLTLTGLADRTALHVPMPAGAVAPFFPVTGYGARVNVPEAGDYTLAYSIALPNSAAFNSTGAAYRVDNHFGVADFDRVAYYLELQTVAGDTNLNWIWVSMDAFTADAGRIGFPALATGAFFQQPASNLNVYSTSLAVGGGTNLPGNLEFWSLNYSASNAAGVAGASDINLDWGDQANPGGYGSMQVHNPSAGQVLFAINNWGGGGTLDLGIGNNLNNTNADYTFLNNAATYSVKNLQVYVRPRPDSTPPSIVSIVASQDRTRITVTFDEPLADGAANLANFALAGGPALLGAVLSADLRSVVLTTGFQPPGPGLALSVQGVRDRSPGANLMVPVVAAPVTPDAPPAAITSRVPEAASYQLACQLNIPATSPGWNDNGTVYTLDQRSTIAPFDRVAYYMELVNTNSPTVTNWIFCAMDPFSYDLGKIGVPDRLCGAVFQQLVTNLDVRSNVAGVTNDTGMTGGNIEFWPFDYSAATNAVVPGSPTVYDWSDSISKTKFGWAGHGSMQVHHAGGSNVLFAYNNWGGSGTAAVGIGTQTTNHPDWTQSGNAGAFSARTIYVLARPAPDALPPAIVSVAGSPGRTNVLVTFNEPLEPVSAANPANYALDGGLNVAGAALRPNLREVVLTTDPQSAGTLYTLTVSGVLDRAAASNAVPAGTTATFTALPALPFAASVAESANYQMALQMPLPGTNPNWNVTAPVYPVDLRGFITGSFDRVAYYVEVATNAASGPTNWVWVSANTFTRHPARIGVPSIDVSSGVLQKLTNMNVYSSLAELVSGTNIAGNMEFWPFNYSVGTNATVTGSNTTYDWSDTVSASTIGFGSMQIHAWSTGQVLFAYNHWGSGGGAADIGIGNRPTGHPDWTQSNSATNLEVRNLYVLVRPVTTSAPPAAPLPATVVRSPDGGLVQEGQPVRLTVLASGGGTLGYQWRLNGAALPGETNAWLELPSAQAANDGTYDTIVFNASGTSTSEVAELDVNRPPLAGQDRFAGAVQDQPMTMAQVDLLAGTGDPDGDNVTFAGTSAASTNGGTVGAAAGNVNYTPVGGFVGTDRFTFYIADGRGGGATGAVRVVVVAAATYNRVDAIGRTGGVWSVGYSGLPAANYALQRSTNLVDWTTITNLPAGEDGSVRVNDPAPPPSRSLFYRALAP